MNIDKSNIEAILSHDDDTLEKAKKLREVIRELDKAAERMESDTIVGFSMSFTNGGLKTVATYAQSGQFEYTYPLKQNMMNAGVAGLISTYAADLQEQINELIGND